MQSRDALGAHFSAAKIALQGSPLNIDAVGFVIGLTCNRVVGTPDSLAQAAIRSGQRWLCVPDNPLGMSAV